MTTRLSAFFVWALLAASVVFWGLRLGASSPAAPPHTVPVGGLSVPHVAWSRLLGAEPPPPAEDQQQQPDFAARFHLLGVVAPTLSGGPGIASISVDGKPPRAYRVGQVLDGDTVLQSIQARGVDIGPAGAAPKAHLDIPPLASAPSGSLPPPDMSGIQNAEPQPAAVQPVAVPNPSQMVGRSGFAPMMRGGPAAMMRRFAHPGMIQPGIPRGAVNVNNAPPTYQTMPNNYQPATPEPPAQDPSAEQQPQDGQ